MASGFNTTRQERKTDFKLNVFSATAVTEQIHSFFSEIEDPRSQRTRAHLLTDILIIGILSAKRSATPCGVRRV